MAARTVLILLLCSIGGYVNAGCQDPWKSLTTHEGTRVTLNTYATGAKFCIVKPTDCPGCKDGWLHQCMASGKWRPYEACTPGQLEAAGRISQNPTNVSLRQSDSAESNQNEVVTYGAYECIVVEDVNSTDHKARRLINNCGFDIEAYWRGPNGSWSSAPIPASGDRYTDSGAVKAIACAKGLRFDDAVGTCRKFAQTTDAGPARPAVGTEIPITSLKRTRTVSPIYPRTAREQHVEGWVEAMLTISPDGKVVSAEVHRSDPPGVFEDAALTSLRQWAFEPTGRGSNVKGIIRLKFAQTTDAGEARPAVATMSGPQQTLSRPTPTKPPDLSRQIASAQAAVDKAVDKVSECRNASMIVEQACTTQTRNPTLGGAGCAIQRGLYDNMGCEPGSLAAEESEARLQLREVQNRQRQQQQSYEAALRAASAPPPSAPASYSSGTPGGTPTVSTSSSATGCPRDLSYLLPTLSPLLLSTPGVADSLKQPLDDWASDRATLEKTIASVMVQRDAYKDTEENGKRCAQQLDANGSLDDSWVDYSREPSGAREMCFHQMRLGQDGVRISEATIKALECRRGRF